MTTTVFLIGVLAFLSVYSYFIYPLVLLAARKAPFAARNIARREAAVRGPRSDQARASEGDAVLATAGLSDPFGAHGGLAHDNAGSAGPRGNPADGIAYPLHARDGVVLMGGEYGNPRFEPRISLIITAHNEQDRIRAKLENSVTLDYDPERLEIIVASDASTDSTEEIAASYPGVKIAKVAVRKGKEHAQKHGILGSTGEILVFSDVATLLDKEALRLLVRQFEDPTIGALSSTDKMIGEDGKPSGEGLYVRYEMLLRRLESDVRGVVGMSGSFFAARRSVCMLWAEDLPSDFNTVMNCVRLGYRAVSDDAVIGYYKDIKLGQSEFQRKVRTLVRGITALFANLEMLDFRRFGFFSFQLLSHKLMRWLAPVFMILLVPATLAGMAMGQRAAYAAGAFQALFYGLALLGLVSASAQGSTLVKVPFFFAQANAAILAAWIKYLRGERITMWAPSKR
ncbi:MAG: glycosyl transferase, family 2 [Fibrobacteres bacterium]|nr:glycosyl transferase, family 2 [Fibrobacterota bacterium]